MLGAKMREPLMMPHMLTPIMRCQLSGSPNNVLPGWMPALFMRMSVPPKRSRTARFQFRHALGLADVDRERHHMCGRRLDG